MACESCGEKKTPKDNCSFTKAVVEINNPETLTLLRKVVVPSSIGDENTNPPKVGAYCNVLLYYEATGMAYLYSSDGIPTLLTISVEALQDLIEQVADLEEEIDGKQDKLTAGDNIQINGDVISATDTIYDDTEVKSDITNLQNAVQGIEEKIPSAASLTNQLADKNFVNSSIATNTANFIGTFNSVAELEAYSGPLTNNDYAFVIVTDAAGNTAYDRYKYNGDTSEWLFEYELNNSSFTANQWAAINSGITSGDVTKIQTLANIRTIGANLNLDANGELSAVDTTYTHFTGATSSTDGVQGLVPGPLAGDEDKYLKADGTWATVSQYSLPAATASTLGGVKIGANLSMDANDVLSATDTTYSDFVGTDGQTAGTAGLVPAPATTDAGKFLKADGTWDDAGSPINVVQTTGTSTTDVMSQDAVTKMVYADPSTKYNIQIGNGASNTGSWATVIGYNAKATSPGAISIGQGATTSSTGSVYAIAMGAAARCDYQGGIALGTLSTVSANGEMNIGSSNTSYGYKSSSYRLISGVYDGESAHDAATYGQVISYSAINGAGAPTTATEGKYIGQLYYDTTNEAMYFLKSIDTTTTPTTYTWEALGGGSSVNVVQTTGTSTTDVMSQNAVTSMVFADPSTKTRIRVGTGYCTGAYAIMLGRGNASGTYAISIGDGSVGGKGSMAFGIGSRGSTTQGVVSFELVSNAYGGYNNTVYKLLTGLYDPQGDHDAATKGYVDTAVASAGVEAFTTNEWEALWA